MNKVSRGAARALDVTANVWRDFLDLIPSLLTRYAFVDGNQDHRACVLLAGSGRSGTTWLANVINYDNSYRLMFEPFYRARVAECRAFSDLQYLRPDDSDPVFLSAAERIFSGRVRNRWVDSHNRRLRAERRLVKDVRANLFLSWIKAHFPEIPIILLLRHPCAVANSRRISHWPADLERLFASQPALMEDHLEQFRHLMYSAATEFERHVFSWCVETYVPLVRFHPKDILVTTYEDCIATPHAEIKRIFDYLNRPLRSEVFQALKKPSSQARYNKRSHNASAIVLGQSVVDSWMRHVNGEDLERAMAILRLFGLDAIYGSGAMPHPGSAERFMRNVKVIHA